MRNKIEQRYDLLDPDFIDGMACAMHEGFEKYDKKSDKPDAVFGELNWQRSPMTGNASPINHALRHIFEYMANGDNDDQLPYTHLYNAAVNLMFECWYARKKIESERSAAW